MATTLAAQVAVDNRRPLRGLPLQLTRQSGLTDTGYVMVYDLRTILEGWEYEPGKISVRKIIGRDGREKVQTRVDLGVLQFEPDGRPDGVRPFGCESLLDYFERRLEEYVERNGSDEGFVLSPEACRDLRHEAYLYYQRYLSFFVLEEYDKVERDTLRNLRLIDFCSTYAESEYDRETLESQRPYVMMMHIRARVYGLMAEGDHEAALRQVDRGIRDLRDVFEARDESLLHGDDEPVELRVLAALREEVLERMPPDSVVRLRHELRQAVAREDYERAARLRDRLAALSARTQHV